LNLSQPAELNQQDDDVVQRLLKKAEQGQELNELARDDFRHREVRSLPRGPPSNLPLCFCIKWRCHFNIFLAQTCSGPLDQQQSLEEKDDNISGWGPRIFGSNWLWYWIGLKLNVLSNLCNCPPGMHLIVLFS
jgi:hypothetical protein